MWLPKDERRLFLYYAVKAQKAGEACEVSDDELLKSLKLLNVERLHDLKSKLKEYGLIDFSSFRQHETTLNVRGKIVPKTSQFPVVRFTKFGERFAEKCNTWFGRIELWCKEYMWFLILLSVIIGLVGVIATILVAILKD